MSRDAAARPQHGRHVDRCPYPRPFPADFGACPTYEAVSFVPTDSLRQCLDSIATCRHLTVGDDGREGRFYPRCALGGPQERRRWLATRGSGVNVPVASAASGEVRPPG